MASAVEANRTTAEQSVLLSSAGTKDALEREILAVERRITEAMDGVVSTIERQYVECVPDLITSNKLLKTVRTACETADRSLDSIADNIKSLEKEIELDKSVMNRVAAIKNWKSEIKLLEDVELLTSQLWYSSNEENTLTNAKLIRELEDKLNLLSEVVLLTGIFTPLLYRKLKFCYGEEWAMDGVVSTIERQYVECVPDLITSNKLLKTVRTACETADRSLDSIADNIKSLEKEIELDIIAISIVGTEDKKLAKSVMNRVAAIKNWKSEIKLLEDVELLTSQLWYSSNEENTLTNAKLIRELEDKLNLLSEKDVTMDKVFEGRIVPSLKEEVSALRRALTYMLNNFWDETFWLRKMNDKIILQIPTSASAALNEKLSAMDVLNLIDGKISKLASTLMQYFCQPIISATELAGIIDYRSTISLTRRDYIVQKKQSTAEGTKKNPDAKKVFRWVLLRF
ncbi:unnamed protein product [Gongylonema pulchrum]|uniref:Conserved oligomeric Golgi complex subunit 7 n=1 Tax=Gongylonema pulchrum TaxID=637853 RepID=A0A183DSD0_9BILA|nr:unnamed protein product [Gongylonema pulchrum]